MSSHQKPSREAGREPEIRDPLVTLESHMAELERMVDQLNQVVIEQGKRLQRLENQQKEVASTVEGIEMDRIRSTHSKPPHSVI